MIVFAYIFIGLAAFITLFQLALAFGAPWGDFTLGGKYPGKLPAKLRIAAIVQIIILFGFTAMVASKAGIAFGAINQIAQTGIWFVLAFFVLGTVLNLSSPSKKEKYLMGPFNIIALVSVLVVALH